MNLPRATIISIACLLGLAGCKNTQGTLPLMGSRAQADIDVLCPHMGQLDPLGRDMIIYRQQHGQAADDLIRHCQALEQKRYPTQQQVAQQDAAEQKAALRKANVLQTAREAFAANPRLETQCYDAYKDMIDDPSPFQVSRDNGGLEYFPMSNSKTGEIVKDIFTLNRNIRHKNQLGILTLYAATCYYTMENNALIFNQFGSSPVNSNISRRIFGGPRPIDW